MRDVLHVIMRALYSAAVTATGTACLLCWYWCQKVSFGNASPRASLQVTMRY